MTKCKSCETLLLDNGKWCSRPCYELWAGRVKLQKRENGECARCGEPKLHGQIYCGAGCSARAEVKERIADIGLEVVK